MWHLYIWTCIYMQVKWLNNYKLPYCENMPVSITYLLAFLLDFTALH